MLTDSKNKLLLEVGAIEKLIKKHISFMFHFIFIFYFNKMRRKTIKWGVSFPSVSLAPRMSIVMASMLLPDQLINAQTLLLHVILFFFARSLFSFLRSRAISSTTRGQLKSRAISERARERKEKVQWQKKCRFELKSI
jgi:hypothetical protein